MSILSTLAASPVLSGVVGAGAQIVSGAINSSTQRKVNERNVQATKEANETARRWQLEDRYHDELYNSPAMQAMRLKQAGLNPYDYTDSVPTSSNTPDPQSPNFIAEDGFAQGVSQAGSTLAALPTMQAQFEREMHQAHVAEQEAKLKEKQVKWYDAEKELQLTKLGRSNDLLTKQIENSSLDADSKRISLEYLRSEKDMALAIKAQNLDVLKEQYRKLGVDITGAELENSLKRLKITDIGLEIDGRKIENDLLSQKYEQNAARFPAELRRIEFESSDEVLAYYTQVLEGEASQSMLQSRDSQLKLQAMNEAVDIYLKTMAEEYKLDAKETLLALKTAGFNTATSCIGRVLNLKKCYAEANAAGINAVGNALSLGLGNKLGFTKSL